MSAQPRPRPTALIALVAIGFLLAGIGLLFRQSRPRPSTPPPSQAFEEPTEESIDEALAQIPGAADSAALRARWVDEVRGVDASDLMPERHEVFLRFANARQCTCGCGYTLAGCRTFDPSCEVSLPLVEALLDSIRTGLIGDAEGLRERPARSPSDVGKPSGTGAERRDPTDG